mgnify:CR=1 FL=1
MKENVEKKKFTDKLIGVYDYISYRHDAGDERKI